MKTYFTYCKFHVLYYNQTYEEHILALELNEEDFTVGSQGWTYHIIGIARRFFQHKKPDQVNSVHLAEWRIGEVGTKAASIIIHCREWPNIISGEEENED